MNLVRYCVALICLSFLTGSSGPLAAQGESAQREEEEARVPLESFDDEITVTARKREESLQEVPVAVTVVSGDVLEESAAVDLSDLQPRVPNLTIYPSRAQSNTATAFLRGVGQIDASWGADPGVGIYLDDVYLARPQAALLELFDVERVEVLRGPQGTLYGKNTIGGTIKYITRAITDDFSGSIGSTIGEFGTLDFRASASGALIPGRLRARVAVASLNRDGYGDNLLTGGEVSNEDTQAFRLALDWVAAADVNVQLRLDRTDDDSAEQGLTRLESNFLCPFLNTVCDPLGPFTVESGLEPLNRAESEGYSLIVDWAVNDRWSLKSITAYRDSEREGNIDFDTSPSPITDIFSQSFEEQTTQELRFVYDGGGPFAGVVGLFYLDGTAGGRSDNNSFNLFFTTIQGFTDTDSIALFGDGTYEISPRLSLNVGLRVTEEEKRVVNNNAVFTDATFTTLAAQIGDFDESQSFSSVAPRLGLQYDFSEDFMGYLTLSRGFRSGGFNIRASNAENPRDTVQPFDDEVLTMAEVGFKALLADRSLRLNVAAFYGDYDDIQVSSFTSFDSDGDGVDDLVSASFVNAGEATLSGLEIEYDWISRSVDWLGISGNLSFLDGSSDGFLDENNDGFVDSQVLTNSPDFSGLIELRFDFPAFGGLITGSAGYAYRDDSVLTNEGGPDPRDPSRPLEPLVQPSFGLINAHIGWLAGDGTWQFTLHGRNLGDEEYLLTGYNLPAIGIINGLLGPPRTIAATVSYNF
ncbi:MAG: TonB-dependent receptor [Acidobacteriota bacterium]